MQRRCRALDSSSSFLSNACCGEKIGKSSRIRQKIDWEQSEERSRKQLVDVFAIFPLWTGLYLGVQTVDHTEQIFLLVEKLKFKTNLWRTTISVSSSFSNYHKSFGDLDCIQLHKGNTFLYLEYFTWVKWNSQLHYPRLNCLQLTSSVHKLNSPVHKSWIVHPLSQYHIIILSTLRCCCHWEELLIRINMVK